MPTITPVEAPIASNTQSTPSASDARARAIAALQGTVPVQNPSSISPEESGAIRQTGTSDTVERSSEVTEPESKEAPLSPQYAALARKEKAIRAKAIAQEQAFKAREAALAAKEAELTSKSNPSLDNYISKDKLKENALSVLSELGLTYDQLTEQAIAQQSPEWQMFAQMRQEMQEELRKVREEQAESRKTFEQQQAQAYQQALNQIRNETKNLVNSDPSYEAVKATGSVNDVVELIERTFNEEGRLLTVEEAATAVEEYLIEEATKLSRLGKIQKRLQTPQQVSKPQQSAANQMKTLTNGVGAQKPLSARERALLAFKGDLK
jgi:antitoxin component of RelBE/YafQ-DinJ toxin-antitoxin module